MLPEISLNILDIAQNSTRAGATLVEISLISNTNVHTMEFIIKDNGCGMTPEQIAAVEDPFFTSRTTRKVGLGIPFLKQSAECTGGEFHISSKVGEGTRVSALYHTDHIDCMPLGDITGTVLTIITGHEDVDFVYEYKVDERGFTLDTRQFREILGEVSFSEPEVYAFISEYLKENKKEIDDNINE